MPYKPPQVTGEFRYWLSSNAVDRFRDMVADEKRKLSDLDLGHHLDALIHASLIDRKYTVIIDSDAPAEDTHIVQIQARDGKMAMVVLRQYQPSGYPRPRVVGGPGKPAPYAVTVLASESASANYASGRWKVPNRPLADKLAGVRPVKETPAPVIPIASRKVAPVPVPSPPPPAPTVAGPPAFPGRGGTAIERMEFVRELLRQNPTLKHGGPGGVQEQVKARFGTGMSIATVQQVRDSIPAGVGQPTPATPVPTGSPAAKLATQLADALTHEASAKANLAEATAIAEGATARVEQIMSELAALRK